MATEPTELDMAEGTVLSTDDLTIKSDVDTPSNAIVFSNPDNPVGTISIDDMMATFTGDVKESAKLLFQQQVQMMISDYIGAVEWEDLRFGIDNTIKFNYVSGEESPQEIVVVEFADDGSLGYHGVVDEKAEEFFDYYTNTYGPVLSGLRQGISDGTSRIHQN